MWNLAVLSRMSSPSSPLFIIQMAFCGILPHAMGKGMLLSGLMLEEASVFFCSWLVLLRKKEYCRTSYVPGQLRGVLCCSLSLRLLPTSWAVSTTQGSLHSPSPRPIDCSLFSHDLGKSYSSAASLWLKRGRKRLPYSLLELDHCCTG